MKKLIIAFLMVFTSTPAISARQVIHINFVAGADKVRKAVESTLGYGPFDWVTCEEKDGKVYLKGVVVRPFTRTGISISVKKLDFVKSVTNDIEILPLSMTDDQMRLDLYSSLFSIDSPLYLYGVGAVPDIHIIVNHATITLEGIVNKQADSDIAYIKAREISGTVSVTNNLAVRLTK